MGSLTGNLTSPTDTLRGRISFPGTLNGTLIGLEKIQGYSAYQVAVINGYKCSEEEWLASLKGDTGPAGVYYGTEEPTHPEHLVWVNPEGEEFVGGYYKPVVSQPDEKTMRIAFEPNREGMPAVEARDVILKEGRDGYTPVKGVDYFDGEDGQSGKTPVKGTDYWTEADKTEMVNAVISALPVYNGEAESV